MQLPMLQVNLSVGVGRKAPPPLSTLDSVLYYLVTFGSRVAFEDVSELVHYCDEHICPKLTVQISLTSDLVMYPFLSTSNSEKAHSSFLVVFPVDVMWRAMMYSLKSRVPSSFVSKDRKTC